MKRALFATRRSSLPLAADALRRRRGVAITRSGRVGATALTTPHFLLLYAAMLVAAAGNTALQSVMPAIGREIGIADFWVGDRLHLVGGAVGAARALLGARRAIATAARR